MRELFSVIIYITTAPTVSGVIALVAFSWLVHSVTETNQSGHIKDDLFHKLPHLFSHANNQDSNGRIETGSA